MASIIIANNSIRQSVEKAVAAFGQLDDSDSVFVLVQTEYDNKGNVAASFLDVIDASVKAGYDYVNTIVSPVVCDNNTMLNDNVLYAIWLCKKHSAMFFDKDCIREKHIWKDVEWGGRSKNYNPAGKDPGNVWIPTEDDGKGHITRHILLTREKVIERIFGMVSSDSHKCIVEKGEYVPTCGVAGNKTLRLAGRKEGCPVAGKVIWGTSENMRLVDDSSVTTIVTSPPYWNLKDYFKEGQIGQESYSVYLDRMNDVWKECYRVLDDNGSIWININIRHQKGKTILIPNDFVKQCASIGFYFKGILIWHKSSGIPTGDKNVVDRHEYVLIFSKSENLQLNSDILGTISDYKNKDINGGLFWNINRKAGSVGKKYTHPAIYPNELVSRIVEISSQKGDMVLDPFLGSGTSLIASLNCGRNFTGYEYNEGFKDLMLSRFAPEVACGTYTFVPE